MGDVNSGPGHQLSAKVTRTRAVGGLHNPVPTRLDLHPTEWPHLRLRVLTGAKKLADI
jgi:hypothetical protein